MWRRSAAVSSSLLSPLSTLSITKSLAFHSSQSYFSTPINHRHIASTTRSFTSTTPAATATSAADAQVRQNAGCRICGVCQAPKKRADAFTLKIVCPTSLFFRILWFSLRWEQGSILYSRSPLSLLYDRSRCQALPSSTHLSVTLRSVLKLIIINVRIRMRVGLPKCNVVNAFTAHVHGNIYAHTVLLLFT